jgi:hypothetical protein
MASDVERKKRILDYAMSSRQLFVKLLVLIRWSYVGREVQDVQVFSLHVSILKYPFINPILF